MTEYIVLICAILLTGAISWFGDNYTLENEHRRTWLLLMTLMFISGLVAVVLAVKLIFGAL